MPEGQKKEPESPSARIVSFGELLGGAAAYVMPGVQRPYEWEETEVSLLANDLATALAAGYPFYFVGHVVVAPRQDGGFEIIDGQQRIATVSILIAYVRDRVQSNNPALADALQTRLLTSHGLARLTLRRRDARFFAARIQTPGAALAMAKLQPRKDEIGIPCDTDAQTLIWAAARTIHARLERYANDALAQFAQFLLNQAVVCLIQAPNRAGAAILFRGMNDRGRDLSPADLMKLETIELAGGADDSALEEAARAWEDCEDGLGRRRFADLLELLPLVITGKPLRQRSSLAEWKAALFSAVDPGTLVMGILPKLGAIMRQLTVGEVRSYFPPHDASLADDVERWAKCLALLQDREWYAAALVALWKHGDDPKYLHKFFEGLDRLAFACFLEGADSDVWERRMGAVIRQADDPVALFSAGGAFDLAPDEAGKVMNRLNEPFKRESWRRRAVAFRADAALGGKAYLNAAQLTLEHIAPARHGRRWEADGWAPADTQKFAHLLGNFTLLTEMQNQQASGKLFFEKAAVYFDTKGVTPEAITEDLRRYKDWSTDAVRARTELLAAALLTEWGLFKQRGDR